MQVEETEFYRTRNGNVLGPFTHKPHIGWIVPGLRVSWDNDGRLRRSTIEEHPLDLIAPATIVEASLAPLEERSCEMGDEEGHLFEIVAHLTSKGHGYIDLDNEIVVFTEKGFVEFAKNTFIIGDPMQRIQSGIEKLAYINKRQMMASVGLAVQPEHETLHYHKVLTSHDPMEAYRGKKAEVKVSVASDPQSGRLAPKLEEIKFIEPNASAVTHYEEFVRKNIKQIASVLGVSYQTLASDMTLASKAFAQFKARAEDLQKALDMLRPTADYRLPVGPGVSRKGWPQIGSIWRHKNGNQYEVTGFSAHKNRHYRMPDEFYRAWSKRSGEFPRAYANLTAKLGDVRLTFPSLQAKRDVRPEDSKFTMSLSFPGTVSREQVECIRRQVDETVLRRRAEMMAIDFYLRWIGRNHLFPATYEAAWDAIAGPATEKKPKVNAALGEPYIPAAEQMRNYIDAGRWIDGKPLDTMKPGIRRFLEEIGTTNALGDLIGVMQTNAYSLTAQYKRAGKAGVICVEVELPKAITVDVAR